MKYIFLGVLCFSMCWFLYPTQTYGPTNKNEHHNKNKWVTCSSPEDNRYNSAEVYVGETEFNLLVLQVTNADSMGNSTLAVYRSTQNQSPATALETDTCWNIKIEKQTDNVTFINHVGRRVTGKIQVEKDLITLYLDENIYIKNEVVLKKNTMGEVKNAIARVKEDAKVYLYLKQWDDIKKIKHLDELRNDKDTQQIWIKKKTYSRNWVANQEADLQNQTKKIIEEGKTLKWLFQRAVTNKENALTTLRSSHDYEEIVTNEKYLQYEQDVTAFATHYKEYRRQVNLLKNRKKILETVVAKGEAAQGERNKLNPVIAQYNQAIKTLTISKDIFYKMLGALTQDVAKELDSKT